MEISISKGQGITQAIAANLGLNKDDCRSIKLSTWQSVMTLVDEANTKRLQNNQSSIFTGGNDVSSIGDSSTWHSNFHVNAGDVMQIEDSVFNKIKELLTGKKEEVQHAEEQQVEPPVSEEQSQKTEVSKGEETTIKPAPSDAAHADEQTAEVNAPEETEQAQQIETQDYKLGEKLDTMFKEMGEFDENGKVKDISVDITDNGWRQLAGKKDKTDADKKQLDTDYKESVKRLGLAYHTFIDKKYGDNNGLISKDEYTAYENAGVPEELKSDEEAMAQVKEITETGFNRLDLNKDGQIDYEELSAYIHAMDFGTEDGKSNGLNGKISAYDFMVNSLALSKKEKSKLDEKLAYAYNALFGKKVA